MNEHAYFNKEHTQLQDEHTILVKKHTSTATSFLNPFPDLPHRKQLDFEIIANNRSFVCNRARGSNARQSHIYEEGMRRYGIRIGEYDTIGEYCRRHGHEYSEKVIDIGFGNGSTLIAMAGEKKNTLFFGIDVYTPGIASMYTHLCAKDIDNIRVIHDDALPVLFYKVEDNSIDRIQLFFPDPWPKKRHNKRRLIQKRFLQLCATLLKPNGILWIVTDWEEYAQAIYKVLQLCTHEHMRSIDLAPASLVHDPTLSATLERHRLQTSFEEKGMRRGHAIFPFVYRKIVD